MKNLRALLLLVLIPLPLVGGCINHEVRIEPITLEPIHVTVDVNLHVDHAAEASTQGGESPAPPPASDVPATHT